jgi:hypothetical protein
VTLHDVCLALAKTPVGWPVVVEASIDVRNAFNATATPMTTAVLRSQRASGNSA